MLSRFLRSHSRTHADSSSPSTVQREESVLTRLAPDEDVLRDLFQMESRTNDRLEAEFGLLPGISPQELVANVPYASVINAAFTHAHPAGTRFSGPFRGAWYAARSIQTSQAEVIYHAAVSLSEVGKFKDEMTYDEYLANFTGQFHDLRISQKFAAALDPASYKVSQTLGQTLLLVGSLGLVYPSVRHTGGVVLSASGLRLWPTFAKGGHFGSVGPAHQNPLSNR